MDVSCGVSTQSQTVSGNGIQGAVTWGYDLILEMNWLESYSPMSVHWAKKWVEFEHQGHTVHLQGITPQGYLGNDLSVRQLKTITRPYKTCTVISLCERHACIMGLFGDGLQTWGA